MITTIQVTTKKTKELENVIQQYEADGWKLLNQAKASNYNPWRGLAFSSTTYTLTFSKPD